MMARILPYPLSTMALLAMWVLMAQSASPGQLTLGLFAGILAGQSMALLRPPMTKVYSYRALTKLAAHVLIDVARSNIAVARIVLFHPRERVSGFIHMPLELTNPVSLSILALILTATPGTVWVEFNKRRGELLVHVLDLVDEEEWIEQIKGRYEALLLKAFGA